MHQRERETHRVRVDEKKRMNLMMIEDRDDWNQVTITHTKARAYKQEKEERNGYGDCMTAAGTYGGTLVDGVSGAQKWSTHTRNCT